MITTSAGFNEQIESGNRDYQMLITCTLTSGTVLTIDNSRVWSQGYSYDDALCTEPDTLEIGTAIINKMTLVINNMDEHYSAYDFGDAVLNVQIGLNTGDGIAYISKGTYTVSNAVYDTTLITLTALDNMYKFDTLYQTIPSAPSTVMALVQDACTACGVTLGVQTFDGADTVVSVAPTKDDTYRQMLAWMGQMIGCSWRINNAGELMPVWYNITALGQFYDGGTFAYNDGAVLDGGTFAYDDGDTVDGGSFNDSSYFIIRSLATAQVAVDDTIVTGITIRIENLPQEGSEEEEPTFTDYFTGEPGIVLLIEANPLITADNVQSVLTVLGQRLIEMKYRKGQLLHLSDPRLEAGDVFVYADHKGHAYPMICSQAIFQLGEHQSTTSASPVPLRKAAERYSAQAQTTVQIHKSVQREKNLRETAEAELQEAIDNAPGLYMSTETEGGATVYILHNKPTKAESTIVWKMSSQAVGVSTNGGQTYNAGLTADGTAIVQRLYANAVIAGILQSSDYSPPATGDVYATAGMLVDLNAKVIRSPKFAITSNGTLYATGAYVSGTITATLGSIGGWDINSAQIRSDVTSGTTKYSAIMQSMDSSASTGRFAFAVVEYANGSTTYTDIPFRVNYDGSLLSTKGTIGGWTIGSSRLESTKTISGTIYDSYIQNMDGTDLTRGAFVLRNSTDGGTTWNYPFLVRYNGEGRIGAWNFNATALYKGSSSYSSTTAGSAYIGDDGISFVNKSMRLYATGEHGATEYLARSQYAGLSLRVPGGDIGTVGVYCYSYQGDYTGWLIYYKSGSGAMIPQDLTVGGNIYADYGSISVIPQPIDNGANLNSFTSHGDFYYLAPSSGASITNYPSGAVISNFTLQVIKKGSQCNQILINNSGEMY